MSSIVRALRSPGAMHVVIGTAPSQYPDSPDEKSLPCVRLNARILHATGYVPKKKAGVLDRALDRVVRASGSIPVFLFIQAVLVIWAFLGVPFHRVQLWPIFISDAQAIFSYIFDSFLMRQQLNGYEEAMTVAAELRSRLDSTSRMLRQFVISLPDKDQTPRNINHNVKAFPIELPKETKFTKIISWSSVVLGHIVFVWVYWATIIIWIALGPSNGWSNQWQLYINSSTSALMVFIFSFLAILRERHADYMRTCVDAIYRVDATLELQLRRITRDAVENDEFCIPAARVNPIQRAINYYADVVGTLVGIAILIIVIVVWIAIGPALRYDSNWWLLIGTYAGLIGLNDGFILRNVQAKLRDIEIPQYAALSTEETTLFAELELPMPSVEHCKRTTISHRVSDGMNSICAHEVTVILGVLLIFGLLIGSSVMKWSETGQLLCNIPPSIIESFFMIILITGHNSADAQKRLDLKNVFERRLALLSFIEQTKVSHEKESVCDTNEVNKQQENP